MRASTGSAGPGPGIGGGLTFALAAACGLIVANIYYAQPLVGMIGPSLGLSLAASGLVVTLTQIGYGLGLVFVVPLGDLIESRRLASVILCGTSAAAASAALAPTAGIFLLACLLIGVSSVVAQVLVPLAAHLAPDARRGRVVGNVMSGLLLGILLARPVSSLIAHDAGWRAVFGLSAALMLLLSLVLSRILPRRPPSHDSGYLALLASMWSLLRSSALLRRRAVYHAALFGAFSLFWTAVPLLLAGPEFGFTQRGIAFFALAGAAGAVVAPVAGRLADKGWTERGIGVAILIVAASFALALPAGRGSIALLIGAAILLDLGVSSNLILSQRSIYAIDAAARSRLNGVFMSIFFAGGACGSALASWTYAKAGWPGVTAAGLGFAALAALLYVFELVGRLRRAH
jgi:predicted MFS family arabinose efflux permease